MEIKNEKKEEKKVISSTGSRYYYPIEYKWSEAEKIFVPYYGKPVDRYEMIQACAPSCDINYIVKRALAGDITALNVRAGTYCDISEIPDNLNDLNEFNNLSLKQFNNLDPNIKKLFGNNYDKFSEAVANGKINDIVRDFVDTTNEIKAEKKEEKKESDK